MITYKKSLTFILCANALILYADDKLLVGKPQKIKICNNGQQQLQVTHKVPEYAQANVEMVRLPEPQIMLHEGILNNSTQEILDAVKLGANVNLDIDGKLPIFIAMAAKKMNAVEVLKRCGAAVPSLQNIMYRAILNDSPAEIRYALKAGLSIEEAIRDKKSPLLWAISLSRRNAVRVLIECGARIDVKYLATSQINAYARAVDAQCYRLVTPLEHALLLNDIETALILLKNGADSKKVVLCGSDVFTYVVKSIDPHGIEATVLEFLQELVNKGYDINSPWFETHLVNNEITQHASAWASALQSPYFLTEVLEMLMKNGANPNQLIHEQGGTNMTPLLIAIRNNNVKAVRCLLALGADINQQTVWATYPNNRTTYTPLSYAQSLKHFDNSEIMQLLRQHNVKAARDWRR